MRPATSEAARTTAVRRPFLLPSPVMPDPTDELAVKMTRAFARGVPHNLALGMRPLDVTPAGASFELPYDARLVGNPETGTLHGGAITALLDACSGAAVFAALASLVPIATLDLRIDYLKPAEPGKSVFGKATCYKMTRNVAFTRGFAYQDHPDNVIAHSVGTFMLSTKVGNIKS
jgi:uncharacterized protein (TIGR00369 family)